MMRQVLFCLNRYISRRCCSFLSIMKMDYILILLVTTQLFHEVTFRNLNVIVSIYLVYVKH